MEQPDVVQYLDYRAFLRDWLAWRAGRPSLRGFARRVRCSPSLVSSIIAGKRDLDTGRAEVFATAMKLTPAQTSHLVALVVFAHDASRERRQRALDEVLTTRRFHTAPRLNEATFTLLSDPVVGAVFELARCDGWRDDPDWIAAALHPPTTREAAVAALDVLLAAGVLARDGSGRLRAREGELATDHDIHLDVVNLAADQLHRRILARAPDLLDGVPHEQRQFGALTFAVPSSAIPELKARVARFYEETMHLVEMTKGSRDRVYQLCVQLFPVASTSVDLQDEPGRGPRERSGHDVDGRQGDGRDL
jgi:uncharacterized protein (TIGR02147 family)